MEASFSPIMEPTLMDEPPEEAEAGSGMKRALWLLAISLLLLLLPLLLIQQEISGRAGTAAAELATVQAQVESLDISPEERTLRDEFTALREQQLQVNNTVTALNTLNIDYPAVLAVIGQYDLEYMALQDIQQRDDAALRLHGLARDENCIMIYKRYLDENGLFHEVEVLSVTRNQTEPDNSPQQATPAPAAYYAFEFVMLVHVLQEDSDVE